MFINLEATPYIARTDPQQGLVLQTGQALSMIEQVFMTETGALVMRAEDVTAQLDDRDLAQVLQAMTLDGQPVVDEALLGWLDNGGGSGELVLRWQEHDLKVERLAADEAPQRFGFVRRPDRLADATESPAS